MRRESWWTDLRVANPMTRYPRYEEVRAEWMPDFEGFGVVVEAADGTLGYAPGNYGVPVATLVDEYLGERVVGEDAIAFAMIGPVAATNCIFCSADTVPRREGCMSARN
jgi:hypothetical protein